MIFTCRSFTGHYPVGVAAVVQADNAEEAARLLNEELKTHGLKGDAEPHKMIPWVGGVDVVRVLCNGDY